MISYRTEVRTPDKTNLVDVSPSKNFQEAAIKAQEWLDVMPGARLVGILEETEYHQIIADARMGR